MEGDLLRTIQNNLQCLGRAPAASNPGRNPFDDTPALDDVGIGKAIANTGYPGSLPPEYTPRRDALATLEKRTQIGEV